jgi:hypothetical protein
LCVWTFISVFVSARRHASAFENRRTVQTMRKTA